MKGGIKDYSDFPLRFIDAFDPILKKGNNLTRANVLEKKTFNRLYKKNEADAEAEASGNTKTDEVKQKPSFRYYPAPSIQTITGEFDIQAKVKAMKFVFFHAAGDYFPDEYTVEKANKDTDGNSGGIPRTFTDVFVHKFMGGQAYDEYLKNYKNDVYAALKDAIDFRNSFSHKTDGFVISIPEAAEFLAEYYLSESDIDSCEKYLRRVRELGSGKYKTIRNLNLYKAEKLIASGNVSSVYSMAKSL